LDYYKGTGCEKILKLDFDYNRITRNLEQMKYEAPVYVCEGDKLLFSNMVHSQAGSDFETFDDRGKAAIVKTIHTYGTEWKIYVMKPDKSAWIQIQKFFPFLFFLVLLNIGMPILFLQILNQSFTNRLWVLSKAFDGVNKERLQKISHINGKDELGTLMQNYNQMANRMNDLIETVYKERLREQEENIARKNAELLALHSQINPHFLFNALESIRMHIVIKKEKETAYIVEKLALMERQYVDWGTDFVTISKEMEFVEAYLELQKYRFGDRLSYTLLIENGLGDLRISKLTLVTFVENACVNVIEDKIAGGWIFVRIYKRKEQLYLEIEDTGSVMKEEEIKKLRNQMEQANMEDLKKQRGVGMMNACLRLRMMTQNRVKFDLESEEGTGTIVTICLPLEDIESY
jgi:two-component system sensor histidine kinase YesM